MLNRQITDRGHDGRTYILQTMEGKPVFQGEHVNNFRGVDYIIMGGIAPRHMGNGHVTAREPGLTYASDYHVSVFGLKWATIEPLPEQAKPLEEVWVVNSNVSWEHEVRGIYSTREQAEALIEKLGPSAWLTRHPINTATRGQHC